MSHANFSIVISRPDKLIIADDGPWDEHPTITNDAEWVVAQLAPKLAGRTLLYFDSDGELSELAVKDGRFAGFLPWKAA